MRARNQSSSPTTSSAQGAATPTRSGRRRLGARDLALIASFAAFIVVLGLPGALFTGSPVPITLQTLGVMIAAAILGPRRATLAVLVVLALCAVGLPVLAGGRGGLGVFAGPTVGYLIGWVPGTWLTAVVVQRLRRLTFAPIVAAVALGGVIVIHVFGIVGMMARAGLGLQAALLADAVFLPGDLIKAVLAALVAVTVHRAAPDLLPRPTRQRGA